jgi:hypothetical protein
MPIQIRNTRPASLLSEPARQGFTTLLLTGLLGFVVTRWFIVTRKKDKAKS